MPCRKCSVEMYNVQTLYYAVVQHKCKFINSIMSSNNSLCEICQEFACREGTLSNYFDYKTMRLDSFLDRLYVNCLLTYLLKFRYMSTFLYV